MRARTWIASVLAIVALAACTGSPSGRPAHRAGGPPDVLILGSASGVMSLDAADGTVPFSGAAVPSFADWSTVFTATRAGGSTTLRGVRAGTGEDVSSTTFRGDLDVRVAAADGSWVALMAPLPAGAAPWSPGPRAWTTIVVADPTGAAGPLRFHLRGNYEPEAFSTDAGRLYLISYLPPEHPLRYRVVNLDLTDGKVRPVVGRQKQWVGTMTGTRLMQAPAADGTFLFTLYSNQPPSAAKGYDAVQAAADRPVAFVHTLNLDAGQAVCIGLPRSLWGGNPAYEAIASSPTDSRVFVVDTSRGIVAVMRSDLLQVVQRAQVDFGLPAVGTQAEATVSPEGDELFVSTGSAVVVLDADTLVPTAKWNAARPVSGLGLSTDGRRLFLSTPGRVEVVRPLSGAVTRTIPVSGVDGIRAVGWLAA
jgi:hypothetical protein